MCIRSRCITTQLPPSFTIENNNRAATTNQPTNQPINQSTNQPINQHHGPPPNQVTVSNMSGSEAASFPLTVRPEKPHDLRWGTAKTWVPKKRGWKKSRPRYIYIYNHYSIKKNHLVFWCVVTLTFFICCFWTFWVCLLCAWQFEPFWEGTLKILGVLLVAPRVKDVETMAQQPDVV